MELAKFTAVVQRAGFTLLSPVPTAKGRILLAERFLDKVEDDDGRTINFPHYEMLWALERDGMREGRTIRFPAYLNEKDGIVYPSPVRSRPEDRLKETIADAEAWIGACEKIGRY